MSVTKLISNQLSQKNKKPILLMADFDYDAVSQVKETLSGIEKKESNKINFLKIDADDFSNQDLQSFAEKLNSDQSVLIVDMRNQFNEKSLEDLAFNKTFNGVNLNGANIIVVMKNTPEVVVPSNLKESLPSFRIERSIPPEPLSASFLVRFKKDKSVKNKMPRSTTNI